ncbi:hypothetical protein H2203_004199 [Taxawa tesnikishii (nom. ined.)]|nr:hypothetical protein H2203_004199 [Dothideales sp. JES 119]
MINANLLNLLLSYSASHRARVLDHPEPATRIALWVRDVFPDLRYALSSNTLVSTSTLATAIMLASLEIISPNTFEVPITWQNHLQIARSMIVSRGGLATMSRSSDKTLNFLSRWFAYLDVLGSLSGSKNEPLSDAYWSYDDEGPQPENKFQIDCFLGFTGRCINLLARVAKMAHECDMERIQDGQIRTDWRPSPATQEEAEKLIKAIEESRQRVHEGCTHTNPPNRRRRRASLRSRKSTPSIRLSTGRD